MSKLKHECGIAGIFAKNKNNNIIEKLIFSISKLQHRGQDSCGIAYIQNEKIKNKTALGLIKDNFSNFKEKSNIAIAHTRYATIGKIDIKNAQPYFFNNVAVCFNGTISENTKYKKILKNAGYAFDTNSDSEIILKWIFFKTNKNPNNWSLDEIRHILNNDFKNKAYSLLILLKDKIFAFKDIYSYRPLIFIETKNEYCIFSEDCATFETPLKKIELKGGQGIELNKNGYILSDPYNSTKSKKCVFEIIYFASKNSNVFNMNVKEKRILLGELLASKDNVDADIVVPVMNSGFWGAYGYSKKRGIKLCFAIKNNKNTLRTFIEKENKRNKTIDEKYKVIKNKVKDKNIIVVDDSIVRGHTVKKITYLLKKNGAKSVHFRLFSPPIINVCNWGVDISSKEELLACKYKSKDNDLIKELKTDSIKYIPYELFCKVFNENQWCHSCFKED